MLKLLLNILTGAGERGRRLFRAGNGMKATPAGLRAALRQLLLVDSQLVRVSAIAAFSARILLCLS